MASVTGDVYMSSVRLNTISWTSLNSGKLLLDASDQTEIIAADIDLTVINKQSGIVENTVAAPLLGL